MSSTGPNKIKEESLYSRVDNLPPFNFRFILRFLDHKLDVCTYVCRFVLNGLFFLFYSNAKAALQS